MTKATFSFNLSNLRPYILRKSEPEILPTLIKAAKAAVEELTQITPVDTGEAAASWTYRVEGDKVILENDEFYVKFLNAGSSQQAPAYFIESVMLKYGTPLGPIVTYK
jgi:hypothetical protein